MLKSWRNFIPELLTHTSLMILIIPVFSTIKVWITKLWRHFISELASQTFLLGFHSFLQVFITLKLRITKLWRHFIPDPPLHTSHNSFPSGLHNNQTLLYQIAETFHLCHDFAHSHMSSHTIKLWITKPQTFQPSLASSTHTSLMTLLITGRSSQQSNYK